MPKVSKSKELTGPNFQRFLKSSIYLASNISKVDGPFNKNWSEIKEEVRAVVRKHSLESYLELHY